MKKHEKLLIVRDSIHGDISIETIYQQIVSHSLFQRLRHIGQTGLLYLIYPGMRHSRFEHSLGSHFLAKIWYRSILEKFSNEQQRRKYFDFSSAEDLVTSDGCSLLLKKTFQIYDHLIGEDNLRSRWERIVGTASLLHDVGHGPLSHTIENYQLLHLSGYESYCSPLITKFLSNIKAGDKVKHEDFSLIYTSKILTDQIDEDFFIKEKHRNLLCVCSLFHKRFRSFMLDDKTDSISDEDRCLIKLFSHVVGGMFDVDRLDYLERDSRHAGVNYGLVEGERIPKSLVPILYSNDRGMEAGLIIKGRMVHSLDHFLVCLFEMYTQLYKHPSYEGFQQEVGCLIEQLKEFIPTFNVGIHEQYTDFRFYELLNQTSEGLFLNLIERKYKTGREVFQKYGDSSAPSSGTHGFKQIGQEDREMIKDGAKVWLIDRTFSGQINLIPWNKTSLVSSKLSSERYNPQIWWKNPELESALSILRNKLSTKGAQRTSGTKG